MVRQSEGTKRIPRIFLILLKSSADRFSPLGSFYFALSGWKGFKGVSETMLVAFNQAAGNEQGRPLILTSSEFEIALSDPSWREGSRTMMVVALRWTVQQHEANINMRRYVITNVNSRDLAK